MLVFCQWLKERDPRKAKKLETIYYLSNNKTSPQSWLFEDVAILVKERIPELSKDFVDFIFSLQNFRYIYNPYVIKYLIDNDFITEDEYKELLASDNHLQNAIIHTERLLRIGAYLLHETEHMFKYILEAVDYKANTKLYIVEMLKKLYNDGIIAKKEKDLVMERLKLV